MKKIILIAITAILVFSLCSCAGYRKGISRYATYKDPQTIGGTWTVRLLTGEVFEHAKCLYWGTEDDTSVFELSDGTIVCQSGACTCIAE